MNDIRRFGPKAADHPSVGKECPACHLPFAEGDYTTLEKAREGLAYNAVALEVHWACASGEQT